MFQTISKGEKRTQDLHTEAPRGSKLFSELLDPNHDAWRVSRQGARWTFYREVGEEERGLPLGAVVLTSEPGRPQTLDLYSSKGRRSLVQSYGEELPRAAQLLIDRERVLALFTKLAYYLDAPSWDHCLSFAKVEVTDRRVALRSTCAAYERLVGDLRSRVGVGANGSFKAMSFTNLPGLVVSEHEGQSPLMECSITYPRPIELRFYSNRLREGLHAITHTMVSLVVEHNRNLEGRVAESDSDEW